MIGGENLEQRQKQLLEQLRSELVGKLHTQPFTIYTDKTITDLIKAQPKTMVELSRVKGFPKDGKRIKGFGEAVLAIFSDTDRIETLQISGDEELQVDVKLGKMEVF